MMRRSRLDPAALLLMTAVVLGGCVARAAGVCLRSDMNGYECMMVMHANGTDAKLHWVWEAGREALSMAAEVPGARGYVSVGFPVRTGKMLPGDLVVFANDTVVPYWTGVLNGSFAIYPDPGVGDRLGLAATSGSYENNNGILRFTRTAKGLETSVGVNIAWHATEKDLVYHNVTRMSAAVDFQTGSRMPKRPCIPSDVAGYVCMLPAPLHGVRVHWTWVDSAARIIRIAVRSRSRGFLAVAFPEVPGSDADADGVVLERGAVTSRRLGLGGDGAVNTTIDFGAGMRMGLANASGSDNDTHTILEFTRTAAGFDRPVGVTIARAWAADAAVTDGHDDRAALLIDFFEGIRIPLAPCTRSDVSPFSCMVPTPLPGAVLHYSWDGVGPSMLLGAEAASSGWIALSFPQTPGTMMPAKAVVHANASVPETRALVTMVEGGNPVDASIVDDISLADAVGIRSNGRSLIAFTRSADAFSVAPVGVNLAFSDDVEFGGWHGPKNRVPLLVDVVSEPPTACVASKLDGYTCVIHDVLPGASLHYRWVNDRTIRLALRSRSLGYLAVSFTELVGRMNPADAIIAANGGVEPWRLEYNEDRTGLNVRVEDAAITERIQLRDASATRQGNYTLLEFTRNARGWRDAPVMVNVARHDNRTLFTGELASQHSAMQPMLIDFVLGRRVPIPVADAGVSVCVPSTLEGYECMAATGLAGADLHWRINDTAEVVDVAVASATAGWLAVSFPENPGRMIPADALVFADGGRVEPYRLTKYTPDGVRSDALVFDRLDATELSGTRAGGTTVLKFTRPLSAMDGPIAINVARDRLRTSLAPHDATSAVAMVVDLQGAGGLTAIVPIEDLSDYRQAHAWLMVVAWCYLAPIGMIMKRYGKTIFGLGNSVKASAGLGTAFITHMASMLAAVVLTLTGFVIAASKFNGTKAEDEHAHITVGYVIFSVAAVMPIVGAIGASIASTANTPARTAFRAVHATCGRLLGLAAYYQVFTGVHKARIYSVPHADVLEWVAVIGVVVMVWTAVIFEFLQTYFIIRSKKRMARYSNSIDKIREDEIKKHDGKSSDPWVIVSGRVFAIKTWMHDHPGGIEMLTENAGGDATDAWRMFAHSRAAMRRMEQYYMGDVEDARMTSAVDLAEDIGRALVSLDLDAASTLIADATDSVPASLLTTLSRLLDNLNSYLPYLPQAIVEASQTATIQTAAQSPTQLQLAITIETTLPSQVAIAFTDIQSSTQLWEGCPAGMKVGLEMHNAAIRAVIARVDGYEVKTIGDAFMVAFLSAKNAFAFALYTQEALVDTEWPKKLMDSHELCTVHTGGGGASGRLWAGPRVRIGVHWGEVDTQRNPVTGRCDFFGNPVNKAARVEAIGVGGCSAVTQEVLDNITAEDMAAFGDVDITPLGKVPLKGVSADKLSLISLVLPPTLRKRKELAQKVLTARSALEKAPARSPAERAPLRSPVVSTTGGPRGRGRGGRVSKAVANSNYRASMATVLTMRVDFAHVLQACLVSDGVDAIVDPVLRECRRTEGLLQTLVGGLCIVSWNLGKRCSDHRTQAVKFAVGIYTAGWGALALHGVWDGHMTCGIATGWAIHGSAGTEKQKLVTMLGGPLALSAHLANFASEKNIFAVTASFPCVPGVAEIPPLANALRVLDKQRVHGSGAPQACAEDDDMLVIHEIDIPALATEEIAWGFSVDEPSDPTWGTTFAYAIDKLLGSEQSEDVKAAAASISEMLTSSHLARTCEICKAAFATCACADCGKQSCRMCSVQLCAQHSVSPVASAGEAGLLYLKEVVARVVAGGAQALPPMGLGLDMRQRPTVAWLGGGEIDDGRTSRRSSTTQGALPSTMLSSERSHHSLQPEFTLQIES